MSARPWSASPSGIVIAVRLTPKGGRDSIDGIDALSDGRSVLKARVRALPSEGEANAVGVIARRGCGARASNRALSAEGGEAKPIGPPGLEAAHLNVQRMGQVAVGLSSAALDYAPHPLIAGKLPRDRYRSRHPTFSVRR